MSGIATRRTTAAALAALQLVQAAWGGPTVPDVGPGKVLGTVVVGGDPKRTLEMNPDVCRRDSDRYGSVWGWFSPEEYKAAEGYCARVEAARSREAAERAKREAERKRLAEERRKKEAQSRQRPPQRRSSPPAAKPAARPAAPRTSAPKAPRKAAPAKEKPASILWGLLGAVGGALIGFVLGGPLGALVGAGLGFGGLTIASGLFG